MVKAVSVSKGLKTEELLRRYFLKAGFFVQRGLKLAYGEHDLTDIDIWAYERSATLSRRRLIIDVKDKAKPQAAERLFFILGVSQMIGVEGAGVATKDNRVALRKLAQKHKVIWLNGEDIQRLKSNQSIAEIQRISEEDFAKLIQKLDQPRGSRMFMSIYKDAKASLADRFGVASANSCLDKVCFLASETVKSYPNSESAETLGRLTYLVASLAAASFDFASAETVLRPFAERRQVIIRAIKFGADENGARDRLNWAEAMIREFAPNGKAIAEKVRRGLTESMEDIPAEDLAEIIAKMSRDQCLFDAARSLEQAAYSPDIPTFDQLPHPAQSYLGSVLDFAQIERKRFRQSWSNVEDVTLDIKEPQPKHTSETNTGGQQKLL